MLCRCAVVAGLPRQGGADPAAAGQLHGQTEQTAIARAFLGQQSNASAAIGLQLQFLAQVMQPTVNYADLIACHGHNPVTRLESDAGRRAARQDAT